MHDMGLRIILTQEIMDAEKRRVSISADLGNELLLRPACCAYVV